MAGRQRLWVDHTPAARSLDSRIVSTAFRSGNGRREELTRGCRS